MTCVFGGKFAEHDCAGQLIPGGLLVTAPLPVPVVVTVRASGPVKVAITFSAAVTVKLHVVVPEQPVQPLKYELVPGVSVSVTWVLSGNTAEHDFAGQLIPGGSLVTLPPPPLIEIFTPSSAMNEAATVVAALIVTVQVWPEQAPLQLPNR